MKNRKMIWLAALVLATAPALSLRAQEGPDMDESEEIEVWDGGPGAMKGEPGMGRKGGMKGAPGGKRMMWIEKGEEGEGGNRQMTVRVRKMRGEMGGGKMETEALTIIKKHDPAFANKLAELKTSAPAKYKMALAMTWKALMGGKAQDNEAMEKDIVRGASLEFEVKELSRKMEKASDGDKAKIKESMKSKLSEIFDLRTKGQEMRVKRMEGDIIKIKARLEKRKANKGKIVDQRLEQLSGEGYGW